MDPKEFFFLILPLAVLVVILVIAVLHYARKENEIRHKDLETLNDLMLTGVVDKENFSTALQGLIRHKLIDKDSFERLGKLLEDSFNESQEH